MIKQFKSNLDPKKSFKVFLEGLKSEVLHIQDLNVSNSSALPNSSYGMRQFNPNMSPRPEGTFVVSNSTMLNEIVPLVSAIVPLNRGPATPKENTKSLFMFNEEGNGFVLNAQAASTMTYGIADYLVFEKNPGYLGYYVVFHTTYTEEEKAILKNVKIVEFDPGAMYRLQTQASGDEGGVTNMIVVPDDVYPLIAKVAEKSIAGQFPFNAPLTTASVLQLVHSHMLMNQ